MDLSDHNVIRSVDIQPPKERNQAHRAGDTTRIRASLGWKPSTLLKHGLRNTYDWIESQSEALACV